MNFLRTLGSNQRVALRRISEGEWAPYVRQDLKGSGFWGPCFECRCGNDTVWGGQKKLTTHHGFALYMTRAFRALIQRKLLLVAEDGRVYLSPEAEKKFPVVPKKEEAREVIMNRTRAARSEA